VIGFVHVKPLGGTVAAMSATALPLLGREAELTALERALGAVEAGRSCAVGVVGEPGIGKSRLLAELAERAGERGLRVLAGRAGELERDLTFAVLADALEPAVSDQGGGPVAALEPWQRRELAAMLPSVGSPDEVRPAVLSGERHRVARVVRALLERLAAERPLAVLLDDVQWADPASVDVLALLLHRPPTGGVLLALAARAGRARELEAALAAGERGGTAEVLELGPVPPEVAEQLLPAVGRTARERLYHDSGGNPFFLQELARTTNLGSADGPPRAAGVPRTVQAAIARELAVLPDGVRGVLEGAAVAGDPFDVELAGAAAGVVEADVLGCLDELLAADLIRPTAQARRFRFRHPLVRHAVYEGAGGGWRLAAHARAAAALAARGATPAQRAHHVERAARTGDLAAVELLAAAAAEVAPTAPATAGDWYEAALRLLPDAADHAERRLTLLRARGAALLSAGRPAEARAVLRKVLAMLPRDATEERVRVVEALADLEALWLHNYDGARRLLSTERDALADAQPRLRAALTFALVRERAATGHHEEAERLAGEARAAARAAHDRPLEAAAAVLEADAAHCALRRDDSRALAAVDRKIAEAQALVGALSDEQAAERLQMLFWLGVARWFTGSFQAARAQAERGLELARRTGQGMLAPSFVMLRGGTCLEVGQIDAAEVDANEAFESALVSGNEQVAYWSSVGLAWIALARGKPEDAIAMAETSRKLVGMRPVSQLGWTIAEARLGLRDPEGALAALETYGGVNPGLWTLERVRALEVLVRVLLALDRVEEADRWARRVPVESGGRRTGVFGAIDARARAAVLLARGDPADAARVALAGAEAADEGLAPLWAGRCRTLAGEALGACGRREDARRELRRAAQDLDARGAWGYRDAAVQALRRLGDRPRAFAPEPVAGSNDDRLARLSPREREVATLVAGGSTNAQIAARLHLSERTVEKHVSNALAKLGLSSRTAVVGLLAGEQRGLSG
jgi:predicted ATPase/DNA-binding CsgD family transcriptional regulator